MTFDVFYCCYGSGDEVSGDGAIARESAEIWPLAQRMLCEPDDFFGVVDAANTTLQVMVDADGSYWTEIPAPKERGSYGSKLTQPQLQALLEALPELFDVTTIPHADFQPW